MGITKAERKRLERERLDAEWKAEEARVRALGDLFSALPDCSQRDALQEAMTDRIIDLYNNVKFEQGDAILEFLPNDYARAFLDWYFDEDASATPPLVRPLIRCGEGDPASDPGLVAGSPMPEIQ